jgi:glucokinase
MDKKENMMAAGGALAALGALAYMMTPGSGKTEETSATPAAASGSSSTNKFDNVIIGDIGGTNVRF